MRTLAALALLTAVAVSPAAAATIAPVDILTVYDAQGTRVGRVVGLEQQSSPNGWEALVAYRDRAGRVALIRVERDGFSLRGESFPSAQYYLQPNCSGPSYLQYQSQNYIFSVATTINGRSVYFPVPGTAANVTIRSMRTLQGCLPSNFTGLYERAVRAATFVPPFTVRGAVAATPAGAGSAGVDDE